MCCGLSEFDSDLLYGDLRKVSTTSIDVIGQCSPFLERRITPAEKETPLFSGAHSQFQKLIITLEAISKIVTDVIARNSLRILCKSDEAICVWACSQFYPSHRLLRQKNASQ
jgi:hypothetical protein